MNNKIILILCFTVFISVQFYKIKASPNPSKSPNINQGEVLRTSPFDIIQKKDSLLEAEYDSVKKLYDNKKYSSALDLGLKFLNKIEDTDNIELEYRTRFIIGGIFNSINNHEKALDYYKSALSILAKINRSSLELLKFNNSINFDEEQVSALLQIGRSFHMLNKIDSAKFYYKKIENFKSLNKKVEGDKAAAFTNLSGIYMKDSLYDKARIYALKAIEIRKKSNNKISEAAALGNLASIFLVEKKYDEAKKIYSKALDLIENNSSTKAVKNKEKLYYNLAYALFLLKDYKAYEAQEKSYLIKDNLRDQEMRRIVEDVYAKYQAANIKNQVELKKLNAKKTAWFLTALIGLLLVLFGIFIYNYRLRQKNLKLQLNQNKLAQQSEVEKLKSESQIRILNAAIDGKESERKQIAETLHDSVSSLLSSASLHLQASQKQFNGKTPIEVQKSQKIILEASQKIRDLSHTLVSSVLLKFGLKFAITEMAEKYSNSQIKISVKAKNIHRYQQNFEIKMNNIIQELVNNILKHSKASEAIISLEEQSDHLIVKISDNGQGFNLKKVSEKSGMGINQIEARVEMLKGKFSVVSAPKKGTEVEIVIPLELYKLTKSV